MKAVAIFPHERKIGLVDHPEPSLSGSRQVKIRMLEVGICGTDREIATFQYGIPPEGYEYLVLGHECLGEVVEVGKDVSGLVAGDLVVPTVRRPCAAACAACAAGRQDFCLTGQYRERGIVREHGFLTGFIVENERNLNRVPQDLRRVGVLAEPLTVTEKAFDQALAIRSRLPWIKGGAEAGTALVLGAGPVGLLAAMKFQVEGYKTFVYSRGSEPGKTTLVEQIGAAFIDSEDVAPNQLEAACEGRIVLVFEAMGAPDLVFEVLRQLGRNAIFVFTGIPRHANPIPVDTSALLYNLVLKNQVILGTVNAAPFHFRTAISDLGIFSNRFPGVLPKLVTERFAIERFREPLAQNIGIKNVIAFD
jgi:threonine dehydrogenase-like Zn-dependent dehydrogenase